MRTARILLAGLLALVAAGCLSPAERRSMERLKTLADGGAIAYSGYRDGQGPEAGVYPSQEQVAEDLRLLARNWRLIRVYAADRHGEDVLEVIRREGLDLGVMLGIWLGREPGNEEANARQIAEGIRLANAYEDIVVAVNVGNEVLIEWTEHPVPLASVIRYVREVREAVRQPVTVADNYVWWRDHGARLAREVDFITMHSYPLWERRDIDAALSFTIENHEQVRAAHPGREIVIGEAGWATYTEGNLHVPRAGDEAKQRRYYQELNAWAEAERVPVFFFEAFDEPWKGTGTEGHWGLFTVEREAKPVMRELYPDRMPDGPTSPGYPERIEPVGPPLAVALRTDLAEAITGGSVNPMGPGLVSAAVATIEEAQGGTALRLVFREEEWAGVYFYLGEHDAGGHRILALRLRMPERVAAFELKLEGPESNPQGVELMRYAKGRDDSGWTTFEVPLDAFDRIDLSRVAIVGLWNPSDRRAVLVPGEVLVDDLRFE